MKTFSDNNITIINEARKKKEPLSKDFELVGKDWHTDEAKAFLKKLDERCAELGLEPETCREAALLWKHGQFEKALYKIWGKSKVKADEHVDDGGYKIVRTFNVNGWGTFTEVTTQSPMGVYSKDIKVDYMYLGGSLDGAEHTLANPFVCYVKANKTGDFVSQREAEEKATWFHTPTARIYNCLFVGYNGRDLASSLSKLHLKLVRKLDA